MMFGSFELTKAVIASTFELERTSYEGLAATVVAGCVATAVGKAAESLRPCAIADLNVQAEFASALFLPSAVDAAKPALWTRASLLSTCKMLPLGALAFVALEYGKDFAGKDSRDSDDRTQFS
jgi:hypothetical protein